MHTTTSQTQHDGAAPECDNVNGQINFRNPAGMTVSTAALRIGLAQIIHEINNPLQQVYWTTRMMDTLMSNANGSGDPFVGKLFEQLKCGLENLISLVGSLEPQLKSLWMLSPSDDWVNSNSLIDDILQSDVLRVHSRGIRIEKEANGELPVIQGDKQLFRHMFLNLFRNAVEAMPKGGILTLRAGIRDTSIWFEFSDTGEGIPPDLDAFQPFITSKSDGLGLGLAITRHIVELHGGTIWYQSEPLKGTTFYLNFPHRIDTNENPIRPENAPDHGAIELETLQNHAVGG